MKRIVLAAMLMVAACAPVPHYIYYFIPQIEFIDGVVPITQAMPFSDLQHCQEIQKRFEENMKQDPNVLSSAGVCIQSDMSLGKPTGVIKEAPAAHEQGSI